MATFLTRNFTSFFTSHYHQQIEFVFMFAITILITYLCIWYITICRYH